jgi:hypothetical protein
MELQAGDPVAGAGAELPTLSSEVSAARVKVSEQPSLGSQGQGELHGIVFEQLGACDLAGGRAPQGVGHGSTGLRATAAQRRDGGVLGAGRLSFVGAWA